MSKNLAKAGLKAMVRRFPWGANEAIFEALYERMGPEQILARCTPTLDHLQLCATGEYGLIQSALNDGLILPAYARSGIYEPRLAELFRDFFARHGGGSSGRIAHNQRAQPGETVGGVSGSEVKVVKRVGEYVQ